MRRQYPQVLNIAHTAFLLWILGWLSPMFKGCIYKHVVVTTFIPRGATCISGWVSSSYKRTFKAHLKHVIFRYENRPQIHIFACTFLNLCIMSFPKFVNMTKNTPYFPILHILLPLNDIRAYIAWSWKTTLITWIFYEDDIELQIPPPQIYTQKSVVCLYCSR